MLHTHNEKGLHGLGVYVCQCDTKFGTKIEWVGIKLQKNVAIVIQREATLSILALTFGYIIFLHILK